MSQAVSTYTAETTYTDSISPGETSADLTSEPDSMMSPGGSVGGGSAAVGSANQDKDKVFWPRDLLPKDFPSARILTYGYDADLVGKSSAAGQRSKLSFSQHGHELMLTLNRELADEVSGFGDLPCFLGSVINGVWMGADGCASRFRLFCVRIVWGEFWLRGSVYCIPFANPVRTPNTTYKIPSSLFQFHPLE